MDIFGLEGQPNLIAHLELVRGVNLIFIPLCGKGHIINAGGNGFRVKIIFDIRNFNSRVILKAPRGSIRPCFQVGIQCNRLKKFMA